MDNYFTDELFDEICVEYNVGSESVYAPLYSTEKLMKIARYEMFIRNSEYRISQRAREKELIAMGYSESYSLTDDGYLRVLLAQDFSVKQIKLLTEA